MKESFCEHEREIIKNAKQASGAQAAKHLAGCAACREAIEAAAFLRAFAAASQPRSLPKPGFILWKARIIEKQLAAERAVKPIVWTQIAAVALTLAAFLWLLLKEQSPLKPVLKIFFVSMELIAAPLLIGFLFAAAVCATFVYKWNYSGDGK